MPVMRFHFGHLKHDRQLLVARIWEATILVGVCLSLV